MPPLFLLEPVQLQFDLARLQLMAVASNRLYLLAGGKLAYHLHLDNPGSVATVDVGAAFATPQARLSGMWVHPDGEHALVGVYDGRVHAVYHLHPLYTQPKPLGKLRGVAVTCVWWLPGSGDAVLCLVGTGDGTVLYAKVLHQPEAAKKDDKHFKTIHKFHEGIRGITGWVREGQARVVVAGDRERVLFEVDLLLYEAIARGLKQPPAATATYLADGPVRCECDASRWVVYSNDTILDAHTERLVGTLLPGGKRPPHLVFSRFHLLAYHSLSQELVALSQLDGTTAFREPLELDSLERVVGLACDYLCPPGTFWVYTNMRVWEVVPHQEARNVWPQLVALGEYETALAAVELPVVRNIIKVKRGRALLGQKEYTAAARQLYDTTELFASVCLAMMKEEGDAAFEGLLEYLVQTHNAEHTTLMQKRLVGSWVVEMLVDRLHRLEQQIDTNKYTTLGQAQPGQELSHGEEETVHRELQAAYTKTNATFEQFVRANLQLLDQQTVYQVMLSFNQQRQLLFYARLVKAYRFMINYHVDHKQWEEALSVLLQVFTEEGSDPGTQDVLYEYASTLMTNAPGATVEAWTRLMGFYPDMDVLRLLPALLGYNRTHLATVSWNDNLALKFLHKVIYSPERQLRERQALYRALHAQELKTVHDAYLCMLVTYPPPAGALGPPIAKEIEKFVRQLRHLDHDFVLRLLIRHEQITPAVHVMILRGLYAGALDLCLSHRELELVEFVIASGEEQGVAGGMRDLLLRVGDEVLIDHAGFSQAKKLWLRFARFLIEEVGKGAEDCLGFVKRSVQVAVEANGGANGGANGEADAEARAQDDRDTPDLSLHYLLILRYLLHRSNSVLTLKDILPLLPDFLTINHFQEDVIQLLQTYTQTILQLSQAMELLKQTAVRIRADIERYKTRFTIVEPGEECQLCGELLVRRQFALFACGHGFHRECLMKHYVAHGDYKFRKAFDELRRERGSDKNGDARDIVDLIILKSCVYCSDTLVNSLGDGFVDGVDERAAAQEWDLH